MLKLLMLMGLFVGNLWFVRLTQEQPGQHPLHTVPLSAPPWPFRAAHDSATATPEGLRLVGRFEVGADNDLRFGWASSSIEARFTGTSLSVQLAEYQPTEVNGKPAHNSFNVRIDALAWPALTLRPYVSTYPLAVGLAPGEHTVQLSKRTEGAVGSVYFTGFLLDLDGRLLPPPPSPPRRIEVIGASNETGYGILREVTAFDMCVYSPATQNADIAYPKLLAQALSADLVNISHAGKGVLQNAYPDQDHSAPMPELLERTDPLDANSRWSFAGPAPDLVLVDLGGNDFFPNPPDPEKFAAAYLRLLQQVRGYYPESYMMCLLPPTVVGESRVGMERAISQAVRAQVEAGDSRLRYFKLDEYTGKQFGCDYHPTAALQQHIAETLLPVVRDQLGW